MGNTILPLRDGLYWPVPSPPNCWGEVMSLESAIGRVATVLETYPFSRNVLPIPRSGELPRFAMEGWRRIRTTHIRQDFMPTYIYPRFVAGCCVSWTAHINQDTRLGLDVLVSMASMSQDTRLGLPLRLRVGGACWACMANTRLGLDVRLVFKLRLIEGALIAMFNPSRMLVRVMSKLRLIYPCLSWVCS